MLKKKKLIKNLNVFNIGNSDKGMKVKDIVKIMHKKYKSKKSYKI